MALMAQHGVMAAGGREQATDSMSLGIARP